MLTVPCLRFIFIKTPAIRKNRALMCGLHLHQRNKVRYTIFDLFSSHSYSCGMIFPFLVWYIHWIRKGKVPIIINEQWKQRQIIEGEDVFKLLNYLCWTLSKLIMSESGWSSEECHLHVSVKLKNLPQDWNYLVFHNTFLLTYLNNYLIWLIDLEDGPCWRV